MKLVTWCLALALVGAGCGGGGGKGSEAKEGSAAASPSVLSRVEALKSVKEEPYDRIKQALQVKEAAAAAGQPVPAGMENVFPLPTSAAGVLAADVRLIAFYDLGVPKLDPKTITVEPVAKVLELYAKLDGDNLRGARPYTHKAFVASLTPEERAQLAKELVELVKKEGFTGHDDIGDKPVGAPNPTALAALASTDASAGKPVAAAVPAQPLYAGTYRTTEGTVTLHQLAADPTDVRGTYSKGSLVCKANGNTLACKWVEPPQGAGLAKFTRAADGALAGTWGFASSDHDGGKWSGELVEVGKLQ